MAGLIQVKPIDIQPVTRPGFDNRRIDTFQAWIDDNALLLAQYFRAQGQALGLGPDDSSELDLWLKVQHHLEATRIEIKELVGGEVA